MAPTARPNLETTEKNLHRVSNGFETGEEGVPGRRTLPDGVLSADPEDDPPSRKFILELCGFFDTSFINTRRHYL